ncbi:MAG: acyltransferase [Candidatus Hermodarchaeota archaeon]
MDEPFVADSAIIEKNVTLGKNVKVWHYCQIRPGAQIGENTQVGSFTYIGLDVKIGKNCSLQSHVYIPQGIILEDNVFIGPCAMFTNDKFPKANSQDWRISKTIVRKGASIGGNATILPGLEIGEGALVGAGAVVTKNVEPFAVVVGNPARKIRSAK